MTVFEPWTIGDATPNQDSNSMTTAALNAVIETLTAAKNTAEITPFSVVFGYAISILTFVRVRTPVPFPLDRKSVV